jgi:hypothetical protein
MSAQIGAECIFVVARQTPHRLFDPQQQPIGVAPDRQIGLPGTAGRAHDS